LHHVIGAVDGCGGLGDAGGVVVVIALGAAVFTLAGEQAVFLGVPDESRRAGIGNA